MHEFEGKLLLIIGQYDGLKSLELSGTAGKSVGVVRIKDEKFGIISVNSAIPFEVIDAIENAMAPDRFRKIVLPGCDHAVSGWLRTNPMYVDNLTHQITDFLNT